MTVPRLFACVVAALLVAACAPNAPRQGRTLDAIDRELERGLSERVTAPVPDSVSRALLPPITVEMPRADGRPVEPRFDLSVANAPAPQVFMAMASGTRFSMVVHPQVKDLITVSLKDVTLADALETLRDLHGFEYRIQGNRILVQPPSLQTKVFQVNYLMSQRRGRSDVRITSGAISDVVNPGIGGQGGIGGVGGIGGTVPLANTPVAPGTLPPGGIANQSLVGSRITTTNDTDFWKELTDALKSIIGTDNGRQVVVSPQSGVVVVRAMPAELRGVDDYLRATRLVLERQVMLEAKIIEVELADGFQAGINWAAFRAGDNQRLSAGVIQPGSTLQTNGDLVTPTARAPDGSILGSSNITASPGSPGNLATGVGTPGTLFGLAFQTANFASLLSFLQTQGNLSVLSSPRIAALNNQKAVLKVGTDEFFVTNVVTTTLTSAAGGAAQSPTINVQPFFSGVALDVTPQIDDTGQIILHVHPSVSNVVEKTKNIDLGTSGNFRLPLASSTISETDTIVRVGDANIVAIGGLMRESTQRNRSGVPGLANAPVVGNAFRSTASAARKSELVILIKPTIVQGDLTWQKDLEDIRTRLQAY
ncbi:MAG: secretin N-terminal domain-containing protein, partial [Burkholderiales bacterium]|nr:secretin N-terminal domain-containing protein [Burkholderiales bacterium]